MHFEEAYIEFETGLFEEDKSGEYEDVEIEESGWVRATSSGRGRQIDRYYSPHVIVTVTDTG